MPKIITPNCDKPTVIALSAIPQVTVVQAIHADVTGDHDSSLGDPADLDVIIEDCEMVYHVSGHYARNPASYEQEEFDAIPKIGARFLDEARNLGAVTLYVVRGAYTNNEHFPGYKLRQKGDTTPEHRVTDAERALHLEPFLNEFSRDFGTAIIEASQSETEWEALVVNQYEEALVLRSPNGSELAIPRIANDDRHIEALEFLMQRTLPALYSQILAKEYRSPRITEIEQKIAENQIDHRKIIDDLEQQRVAEQRWVAQVAPVAQLMDEGLKQSVIYILREVFGLEVIDLDSEYPDSKNSDLLIVESRIVVETRGSQIRNAKISDIDDATIHADILNSRYGVEVNGKVIVFNGMLGRDASRRGEPFAKRIVEESVAQGVSLMTGTELRERAIRHRAGNYNTDTLITEFLAPGAADALDS